MSEIDDLLDQDGADWRAHIDQAAPRRPDCETQADGITDIGSSSHETVTRANGGHARVVGRRSAGNEVQPDSSADDAFSARRHRGLIASMIAVAAAVVLGGAALVGTITQHDDDAAHPLRGTVWQILSYQGHRALGGTATFFIATDGRVVADDACTLLSGTARVDGAWIRIGSPVVREKNCASPTTPSLGQDGAGIVRTALTWRVAKGLLTLSASGVKIALRASALPTPTTDIPTFKGAHWQLDSAHEISGYAVSLGALRGAALHIDGHDRLTADVGCGTLTADVTGSTVRGSLSHVHTDLRACPQPPTGFVADVLQHGVTGFEETVGGTGLAFSVKYSSGSRVEGGTLHYIWVPEDKMATNPRALYNKRWKLASSGASNASYPTLLEIDSDSSFSVTGKCSSLAGSNVPGQRPGLVVGRGTLQFSGSPAPSGGGAPVCRSEAGAPNVGQFRSQLWSIRDGRLVLIPFLSSQGEALVFTQLQTPPKTNALADTKWVLNALTRQGKFQPRVGHGTLTLNFSPAGKVQFDDGVNIHTAQVTVRSTTLTFGPAGSTYVLCGQGPICAQADIINQTFSGQVTWATRNGHLRISRFGALLLDYARDK